MLSEIDSIFQQGGSQNENDLKDTQNGSLLDVENPTNNILQLFQ